MGTLVQAGKTAEFKDGVMRDVPIGGHEILLVKIGNNYYAANNRCPHMGGRLSNGKLEGTVVACPRHGSQFDLRSGEAIRWLGGSGLLYRVGRALKSPRRLATYNVTVENDDILVEI
ncbi:MAG: Rieske 2Fe-2S domain-containing protein [Chloroflexota bacterium]